MKCSFIQEVIDYIRLKKLRLYFNENQNAIRMVINFLSLFDPKGDYLASNFLKYTGVKMGKHTHIHGNITLHNPSNLEMGDNTSLGQNSVLYCWEKIRIGKYTFMGPNNLFVAGGHETDTFKPVLKPIHIGEGCWIGANCTFLGGGGRLEMAA